LDRIPFKKDDNVVVNLSGRGDKDLNTYLVYIEEQKIHL
jgi:tryptophan synthase beta chain